VSTSPTRLGPHRLLIPVLLAVLAFALGGGLLARELYESAAPGADAPVVSDSTVVAPEQQPGPPVVQLTDDAARHPRGETVRRLLQTHFDAINGRNYARWKTTVTRERIRDKPRESWLADYRSTRDGSILVHRIERALGGRLSVLVAFTSTQDVADAPPQLPAGCIRWRLRLPVVTENGQWKIGPVPGGAAPERSRCGVDESGS
jgi:hypothetical protein